MRGTRVFCTADTSCMIEWHRSQPRVLWSRIVPLGTPFRTHLHSVASHLAMESTAKMLKESPPLRTALQNESRASHQVRGYLTSRLSSSSRPLAESLVEIEDLGQGRWIMWRIISYES